MTGWLVDTNVLSALGPGRPPPAPSFVEWFEDHTEELFICAVTVTEIVAGIARLDRMGAARRAERLKVWLERIITLYADRVLPFETAAARVAGELSDAATAAGRHPGFADIALAAIAKSRDLVILTANLRHFEPLGIDAIDPFATTRTS